jgi:ubiquinone/menaquinone biosynthesis C-methylase UbiE
MRWTVSILFLAGLAVSPARGQSPAPLQGPTPEQIAESELEVGRLVPLLRLEPGMAIADVGAGLGAWTLRLSQRTGPAGRVYATDIDEVALTALRTFFAREQLSNVTVLVGAAGATNLPAGCCDAILLRNVFHYVTEPDAMIRSLAASLKPGGRLAIVDYPPRPTTKVPSGVPANRGGIGIPPEVVEREVGTVLRHVTTVPNWAPEFIPAWIPKDVLPAYVAIFEKPR